MPQVLSSSTSGGCTTASSGAGAARQGRRVVGSGVRYATVWLAAACALALGSGSGGGGSAPLTIPGAVASPAMPPVHHLTKRSFFEIQCKGVYDKSKFARLDRICEDCYNLFREPQLHSLCRKNCFTTEYFKGCLETLQLTDEMEQIQSSIKQIHGAEPGV